MTFFSDKTPTGAQIRVLQHLPLWKMASGTRISAINALLLPVENLLPTDAQPPGNYILGESNLARQLILTLGGKMMDPEAYVSGCVFPYIEKILWSKSPKKDKLPKAKPVRPSQPKKAPQDRGCFSVLVGALASSCFPETKPDMPRKARSKKPERPPSVQNIPRQNFPVTLRPRASDVPSQTVPAVANIPAISMVEPTPRSPTPRAMPAESLGTTGVSTSTHPPPQSAKAGISASRKEKARDTNCFSVLGSFCLPKGKAKPSDKARGKMPERPPTNKPNPPATVVATAVDIPIPTATRVTSQRITPVTETALPAGPSSTRAPTITITDRLQPPSTSPPATTRMPEQTTDRPRPREVNPTGLALLHKLLLFICNTPALLCSPFASRPLVPNRNGDLCRIADLYDPKEPVFASTFAGNNSKFPHPSVDTTPLKKMGFNSSLTKPLFMVCVQYLDNEYRTRGPTVTIHQRAVLYQRASDVWKEFNNRITGFRPAWTAPEIQALSDYHFIPVARFVFTFESYRDGAKSNLAESLTRIKDLMEGLDAPLLWTQKYRSATPPALALAALFSFLRPTLPDVAKHLVDLTTMISPKCRIEETGFYQDLIATYTWLSQLPAAGLHLKNQYSDRAIWLNEDIHLSSIAERSRGSNFRRIDSLNWLRSASLVDGISYDAPTSNIFALKSSLTSYKPLLIASGMNVVKRHVTQTVREQFPDHPETILGKSLNEMRKSNSLCDMKIIVDGKTFFAHRTVLATFSSYFRSMLANGAWAETSTGILNLDDAAQPNQRTDGNRTGEAKYATNRSVATVLDWIYKGRISIDDDTNLNGTDGVSDRLDFYLEVLQLVDVWDITTLKTHIENRIIRRTDIFIRVENVSAVGELVNQYNAKEVAKHCKEFVEKNKTVVERIDSEVHA